MISKIKISLSNGESYTLKSPEEIEEIDSNKNAIFLFNNGEIYNGKSDGVIDEDENGEETFSIKKETSKFNLCMPFDRLIGWAYENRK